MPHDRCVFVLMLLSGFVSAHPHPIRNLLLATQVHSDRFQSVADWVRSVCECLHMGFPISASRRSLQSSPKTELLPRSWPAALRHSSDTDNSWLWACGAQLQLNHLGNCGWKWKTRLTNWLFIFVSFWEYVFCSFLTS